MTYNPDKHHRRSIRLKGYDYTQPGGYYITIVVQERECLFGDVVDGKMRLNDAGGMVERWWAELGNKFPHVIPDTCVVMPNHFHGIVVITDEQRTHVGYQGAHNDHQGAHNDHQGAHTGAPLPEIVQWFKTMTTNEYIRGVKTLGWIPFSGKLWQRNYYEHIIRSDVSLERIQQYITDNPARWDEDDENPERAAR